MAYMKMIFIEMKMISRFSYRWKWCHDVQFEMCGRFDVTKSLTIDKQIKKFFFINIGFGKLLTIFLTLATNINIFYYSAK